MQKVFFFLFFFLGGGVVREGIEPYLDTIRAAGLS